MSHIIYNSYDLQKKIFISNLYTQYKITENLMIFVVSFQGKNCFDK